MHLYETHYIKYMSIFSSYFLKYIWFIYLSIIAAMIGLYKFFHTSYSFKYYSPKNIKPEDWNEITKLHQTSYNISKEDIINLAKSRQGFIIYRNRNDNKIIGTAGVTWIEDKNRIVAYIGNVVIADEFQSKGIGVHLVRLFYLYTLLKAPFKKKYIAALTDNPFVYSLFTKS
ncbi:MAG: hypothetical protein K0R94_1083, partial [Burkholderiales bacterium]|nr:hypothetical protein [Burkholderiales bacterium]